VLRGSVPGGVSLAATEASAPLNAAKRGGEGELAAQAIRWLKGNSNFWSCGSTKHEKCIQSFGWKTWREETTRKN